MKATPTLTPDADISFTMVRDRDSGQMKSNIIVRGVFEMDGEELASLWRLVKYSVDRIEGLNITGMPFGGSDAKIGRDFLETILNCRVVEFSAQLQETITNSAFERSEEARADEN